MISPLQERDYSVDISSIKYGTRQSHSIFCNACIHASMPSIDLNALTLESLPYLPARYP